MYSAGGPTSLSEMQAEVVKTESRFQFQYVLNDVQGTELYTKQCVFQMFFQVSYLLAANNCLHMYLF